MKTSFNTIAPSLYSTSISHSKEDIREAIAQVEKAYQLTVIDMNELKILEKIFVDEIEYRNKHQSYLKPERKQELAWKQVAKEDTYETIKLHLPSYLPVQEDGEYQAPAPQKFKMC